MPGAATIILSGTRDELGGVDIGIVNLYERAERPGVDSAKLILPDGEILIAIGDEIALGGRRFLLEAITEHVTDSHNFRFVDVTPATAQPVAGIPIRPIAPTDLTSRLREHSATALALLSHTVVEPLVWTATSKDAWNTEWNGEKIGPITSRVWTATLPEGLEARIGIDLIHYDPAVLYRAEISGFWKANGQSLHLFGRAEGMGDMTEIISGSQAELALKLMIAIDLA